VRYKVSITRNEFTAPFILTPLRWKQASTGLTHNIFRTIWLIFSDKVGISPHIDLFSLERRLMIPMSFSGFFLTA